MVHTVLYCSPVLKMIQYNISFNGQAVVSLSLFLSLSLSIYSSSSAVLHSAVAPHRSLLGHFLEHMVTAVYVLPARRELLLDFWMCPGLVAMYCC